jgi:hypothetical protein
MDRWFSRWSTSSERSLSWGIPQLQAAFKSRYRLPEKIAKLEKLRALAVALLAIVFGFMAYNTCCEEISLEWQKTHVPSPRVWVSSFTGIGFQKVPEKLLAKTLKGLPSRVESGNRVWEGKSQGAPSWWAVYSETDPMLFCLKCDSPPKTWDPAGEGWAGFDQIIAQAEKQAHSYKPDRIEAKKPQKYHEILDPREIRY